MPALDAAIGLERRGTKEASRRAGRLANLAWNLIGHALLLHLGSAILSHVADGVQQYFKRQYSNCTSDESRHLHGVKYKSLGNRWALVTVTRKAAAIPMLETSPKALKRRTYRERGPQNPQPSVWAGHMLRKMKIALLCFGIVGAEVTSVDGREQR